MIGGPVPNNDVRLYQHDKNGEFVEVSLSGGGLTICHNGYCVTRSFKSWRELGWTETKIHPVTRFRNACSSFWHALRKP